jgi:hypothetical protein
VSACNLCCPWNLPLERHQTLVIGAESVGFVPMKFEEWIAYHLHVVLHQAGKYGGQLDEIVAQLKAPQTPAPPTQEVTNG